MVHGIVAGMSYPLRGLGLLRRSPRLWTFLILPIFVNIIVGALIYVGLLLPAWSGLDGAALWLDQWASGWIAQLPAWMGLLENLILGVAWLVKILLTLALFLLTGFLLLQFGTLIGSPWYGQLSEAVERSRLGYATVIDVGIVRDLGRAILFELKKLLLWGAIALILLLLSFVPGIGPLVISLGWFSLTALITGLDFLDGPSERRRYRFRRKLALIFQALPASASFSVVCCLLITIPFLNLLTIPLCVVAGTMFWCDRLAPRLEPTPPSTEPLPLNE
ncbi:EI24 domain-containing protein [Spirulina sp. CCNP1310]|uniref:EI24 domain-containing protein n=1 Tax=Spirulina sp. CCNP1310 TaxID=3110249 RepID=UPI002B1F0CE5|nr:EI24 domain-containing protein [Spirulina sp. CCNP1310]MEA5417679.1 EI24 domain-containing protein [Spirulina sp. CCNP1310]